MAGNQEAGYPRRVHLIGGGRWARVITETLAGIVPAETTIEIQSRHSHEALKAWASGRGLTGRIRVTEEAPVALSAREDVRIIANAAREHARALEGAMDDGVPTLVEKPFAMSAAEAGRLAALARGGGVLLGASHVFLFARYLETFAGAMSTGGVLRHFDVVWSDPTVEVRYGEKKSYDPSLPLHWDVLPHISPILGRLFPGVPQGLENAGIERGGAGVNLGLRLGEASCEVRMARDAPYRERRLRAVMADSEVELDFAAEPSLSLNGGPAVQADPHWHEQERPLACMLRSFLAGARQGALDARLDPEVARRSLELAEQAGEAYDALVSPWLAEAVSGGPPSGSIGEPLRYALREWMTSRVGLSAIEAENRMKRWAAGLAGLPSFSAAMENAAPSCEGSADSACSVSDSVESLS